jgi:two-component system, sensor histidine kinase PdtaS
VINALKHAFPDDRSGKITVDYRSRGRNWTLSVGDNGIGIPKDAESARSGLGTSIVKALATQLDARVEVVDTAPGTEVSIVHTKVAFGGDAAIALTSE